MIRHNTARRGQRGIAVARGDIEHLLSSAQINPFGQLLADAEERRQCGRNRRTIRRCAVCS
jgi:hypothetical protein